MFGESVFHDRAKAEEGGLEDAQNSTEFGDKLLEV